jgi:hypothetical protein
MQAAHLVVSSCIIRLTKSEGATMIERGVYKHFKGGLYLVLDVARHSETSEALVIYRPLYGDYKLTARPLNMFNEDVQHEGETVPRFKLEKAL